MSPRRSRGIVTGANAPVPPAPDQRADFQPDASKPFDTIAYLESFRPSIRTEPEPDFGVDGSSLPPARARRSHHRRVRLGEQNLLP